MIEHWERWEPIPGLVKKYYPEKITEIAGVLSIELIGCNTNKKHRIRIDFYGFIESYRNMYENLRGRLIMNLENKYGTDFCNNWTFFKVNNSEYVKWIDQESLGISSGFDFFHFYFITAESIIDIVVSCEPKVTLL